MGGGSISAKHLNAKTYISSSWNGFVLHGVSLHLLFSIPDKPLKKPVTKFKKVEVLVQFQSVFVQIEMSIQIPY